MTPLIRVTTLLLAAPLLPVLAASTAATYVNPVVPAANDGPYLADPGLIKEGSTYYLYPTQDNSTYKVWTSPDLVHWTEGATVFAPPGATSLWAPDVFKNPTDGKFYLYYTNNHQIGVAVSPTPDGTFTDLGAIPMPKGGLDAQVYEEAGRYYLYYAGGGGSTGTVIWVQEIADPAVDPTSLIGAPIELLSLSQPWESGNVEGPWMFTRDGVYYLMYSSNPGNSPAYAIGYATSRRPTGPFVKFARNPIAKGDPAIGLHGPGHNAVTTDSNGRLWLVYQQNESTTGAWERRIAIDPLWIDKDGHLATTLSRGTPRLAPGVAGSHPADKESSTAPITPARPTP